MAREKAPGWQSALCSVLLRIETTKTDKAAVPCHNGNPWTSAMGRGQVRHRPGAASAPAWYVRCSSSRATPESGGNGTSGTRSPARLATAAQGGHSERPSSLDAIVVASGFRLDARPAWRFVASRPVCLEFLKHAEPPAKSGRRALGSPPSHVHGRACLTPCRSDACVLPFSIVPGLRSSKS